MFHFREPAGAVVSALEMLEALPSHGFPPGHVGVAAEGVTFVELPPAALKGFDKPVCLFDARRT
jgi:hypothetical protein